MGPKQLYVKWQLPSRQHHKPWVSFNPGLSWLQQTVAWAVHVVPLSTHSLSLCLLSEYSCASRAPTRPPAPSDLWFRTSLVAQWLRLCFPCRGMGSIPCQVSFKCCTVREKKKTHKTLIQASHPSTSSGFSLRSLATSSSEGPLALLSSSSESSFSACYHCYCLL